MLKIEFFKDHPQTGHKKGDIAPIIGTRLNPGLAKVAKIIDDKESKDNKKPEDKKSEGKK